MTSKNPKVVSNQQMNVNTHSRSYFTSTSCDATTDCNFSSGVTL